MPTVGGFGGRRGRRQRADVLAGDSIRWQHYEPSVRLLRIRKSASSGACGFHLTRSKWDPYPWVSGVDVGTPAYVCGLKSGDCILEVNGEDVLGLRIAQIAALMSAGGSTQAVTLLLWRSGGHDEQADNTKQKCHPQSLCCAAMPHSLQRLSVVLQTVLSIIECPVCLDTLTPPVMQCQNGHLLCVPCRIRAVQCPVCRERYTPRRALIAEQIYNAIASGFNLCHSEQQLRQLIFSPALATTTHCSDASDKNYTPTDSDACLTHTQQRRLTQSTSDLRQASPQQLELPLPAINSASSSPLNSVASLTSSGVYSALEDSSSSGSNVDDDLLSSSFNAADNDIEDVPTDAETGIGRADVAPVGACSPLKATITPPCRCPCSCGRRRINKGTPAVQQQSVTLNLPHTSSNICADKAATAEYDVGDAASSQQQGDSLTINAELKPGERELVQAAASKECGSNTAMRVRITAAAVSGGVDVMIATRLSGNNKDKAASNANTQPDKATPTGAAEELPVEPNAATRRWQVIAAAPLDKVLPVAGAEADDEANVIEKEQDKVFNDRVDDVNALRVSGDDGGGSSGAATNAQANATEAIVRSMDDDNGLTATTKEAQK